jgi:hypothetical protein
MKVFQKEKTISADSGIAFLSLKKLLKMLFLYLQNSHKRLHCMSLARLYTCIKVRMHGRYHLCCFSFFRISIALFLLTTSLELSSVFLAKAASDRTETETL